MTVPNRTDDRHDMLEKCSNAQVRWLQLEGLGPIYFGERSKRLTNAETRALRWLLKSGLAAVDVADGELVAPLETRPVVITADGREALLAWDAERLPATVTDEWELTGGTDADPEYRISNSFVSLYVESHDDDRDLHAIVAHLNKAGEPA